MAVQWENFNAVPRSKRGKHLLEFDPHFPLQVRSLRLGINDRLTPHYHDYLEVALVVGGRGACEIGSIDSLFAAGDLAVINSTDLHTFWSDPTCPVRLLTVYFLAEIVSPPEGGPDREFLSAFFDRGPGFNPYLKRSQLTGSRVPSIVRAMAATAAKSWTGDPAIARLRLKTDLYRLLLGLRELYAAELDSRRANERKARLGRLAPVFALVHERYGERISLEEAAGAVGMSTFRFCRVFKEATGKTFIGYLHRVRIDRAKELLSDPECPVAFAAAESGFDNASFFSKIFKSLMGVSPIEYRRQARRRAPLSG